MDEDEQHINSDYRPNDPTNATKVAEPSDSLPLRQYMINSLCCKPERVYLLPFTGRAGCHRNAADRVRR